jgi:hypothetical protein
MIKTVEESHPRLVSDNVLMKVPLCNKTGRFRKAMNQNNGVNGLGTGVSQYFKLLKSTVCIFFILSIASIPNYFIFFSGQMKESSISSPLTYLTLGNLGETQD